MMRIASLSPAVTEILSALGKGGDIVCRDQFSDFPEDVRDIPSIRGHQKIDEAELRNHQPDLVFTSTIIQEELAATLRNSGFHVIHQDPRSLNAVSQSILEIGILLDCKTAAQKLTETMRREWNEVKRRAQSLPRRPRVFIEEWPNPPMVSGNWVPEVLKIAGAESFSLENGAPSRAVTLEEIREFNPEMIVLSICGAGMNVETSLITARSGWEDLAAVKNGSIRVIDDSLLNRPGPRLIDGARRVYGWVFELMSSGYRESGSG